MTSLKVGDSVYVNGRAGVIIKIQNKLCIVRFDTGFENEYSIDKIIKKHKHCAKCNRRIQEDKNKDLCDYCRKTKEGEMEYGERNR